MKPSRFISCAITAITPDVRDLSGQDAGVFQYGYAVKDDQQDTEATAIASDLLSGKNAGKPALAWKSVLPKKRQYPAHRGQRQVAGVWLPAINAFFAGVRFEMSNDGWHSFVALMMNPPA